MVFVQLFVWCDRRSLASGSGVSRGWARQQWQARPGEAARATGAGVPWGVRQRVSESESVPTWDPRWLQPVTWWEVTMGSSDQWHTVTSVASDTLNTRGSSWLSSWAKRRAGAETGAPQRRGVDRGAGGTRPSMWGLTGWRRHSARDKQVGAHCAVWRLESEGCCVTSQQRRPLHSLILCLTLFVDQTDCILSISLHPSILLWLIIHGIDSYKL